MRSTKIHIQGDGPFTAVEARRRNCEDPVTDNTELFVVLDAADFLNGTILMSTTVGLWRQLNTVVESCIADIPQERERRAQRQRTVAEHMAVNK